MLGRSRVWRYGIAASLLVAACSPRPAAERAAKVDRSDLPLDRANTDELARFAEGDNLFEATLREADGLGPVYIRASCTACHRADGRGPGQVGKMAVVEDDRVTPASDQTALRYGNAERPYATKSRHAVLRPERDDRVRVTYRFPPAVFGRGYLEAVDDAEIEKLERIARGSTSGIRGRVHRISSEGESASKIGRFGLKARIATLEEFTADAFQNDMGITSPGRPDELPNPDGARDDDKPGIDVGADVVTAVSDYVRLLEIPAREPADARGATLFEKTLCADCHVPALRTRADYPVAALAGIDAPVFTDFLLHDMGPALADGIVDGNAGSREWRTAPLIGLRFFGAYLHDGRAHTLEEAVLAHGGDGSEGAPSIDRFRAMPRADQEELLRFVAAL
jgi:CxxC motif-containing protein (DUF1111 family)